MTLLGIGGIPASHPLNLGMMGMHGEAWVNTAIQEADLLLAFGMRFDDRVTGNLKTYAPNARKVHIDIDPAEIGKNVAVDVGLVGDLRAMLEVLMPGVQPGTRDSWFEHIDALKGDAAVRDIQNLPDDGHLYAAHVIHDIWRTTSGRAIVVTDVGQHQMWEAQYYHHDEPRSLITSGGLGTMGFALPAAIGAKFAQPDAEVWVVAGDGGFQMTMPELATIAQEKLDIKIAIINNGYLGMVRQWQEFFYERRYAATPLLSPDYVKIAEAYGLAASSHLTSRRRDSSRRGGSCTQGHDDPGVPSRAGRHGLPDGAGGRRSARDDSPAQPARGNRGGCLMKPHTFIVTVEDQPGVLNRVSSLFRRRDYNIESLTVGRTERPGVSRMTVVVMSDDAGAGRIEANLYKLVHVISVSDITRPGGVPRSRHHQGGGQPGMPARAGAPGRSVQGADRRPGAGFADD